MSQIQSLLPESPQILQDFLWLELARGLDPGNFAKESDAYPLPTAGMPWRDFYQHHFPQAVKYPYAQRHIGLHDWFDSLTPGVKPRPRLEIVARGGAKSSSGELGVVRLGAKLSRRFVLIVSETQAQADARVQAIAAKFEAMGVGRLVGKYGTSKGWRRDQIRTDNGFNVAALGLDSAARGIKLDDFRPDLILCHEKGTPILTEEGWIPVEEHPTAREVNRNGFKISLNGLPFTETVTPEHRYWTKTVTSGGKNDPVVGNEEWCEAQNITKRHYIGYPIDTTVEPVKPIKVYKPGLITSRNSKGQVIYATGTYEDKLLPEFNDPDWWWLIGLWWGDGHTAGKTQVCLTIADTQIEVYEKVEAVLNKYKIKHSVVQKKGCFQVIFSHAAANRWLKTWRCSGIYRPGQKTPPLWVEKISLDLQRQLILGYIVADGYRDYETSVRITSVSLTGLLALKRILARFGIAGTIRNGMKSRTAVVNGQMCDCQKKYDIRFKDGIEALGLTYEKATRYKFSRSFVEDGFLWSKVRLIEPVDNSVFVPIQTETHEYVTHFGKSHNCDDVDNRHDTPASTAKKIETITQTILPAGSSDCAILLLQNLIIKNGIAAQLYFGKADFLLNCEKATFDPAVRDLQYEQVLDEEGYPKYVITGGTPTWEGQSLASCEAQMNEWGRRAFLREAQHEVFDDEDGLWDRARDITPFRVTEHPALYRICVSVDPSASSKSTSDEAGIIVAGVARINGKVHAYVLDDKSLKASPGKWALEAVTAFKTRGAHVLVAEANNGGEMVSTVLGTVLNAPTVKLIHASKGKLTRAEPIQKLYEDGLVHHVGSFDKLEDEQCTWKPGDPSPNRIDACVWALTELMLGGKSSAEGLAEAASILQTSNSMSPTSVFYGGGVW